MELFILLLPVSVRTAVFDPVDTSVDDAIRYAVYPASAASGSNLKVDTCC